MTSSNNWIQEIEDDVFGKGYQIVMARLRGSHVPPERDRAQLERIINDLFPNHPPLQWPAVVATGQDHRTNCSVSEE